MIRVGSSWCDVVKHGASVEFVHLRGTTVICEHADTGAVRWAVDAGQPLLYLRSAADSDGRVCAIGQGHTDGGAWVVIEGVASPVRVATTATPFPVLITPTQGRTGWTLFVQVASDAYQRIVLTQIGEVLVRTGEPMAPTSQGFLYVASNGQPITQDQGRGAIPGLALPSPALPASTVWAGQSMTVASIALFDSDTGQITPIHTPGGQPPHIVESGGTYYVCSYVDGGAWLSSHRRPFAAATPPVDPPPPPPVEPPKETPVQLESKHSALIEAFAERFGMPGFSKEEGQAWVGKLAATMKARFPADGWGTKRASPSRPLSNESIARWANGRLWGYDLIIGAGAPGQRLESHAHAEDITDQVFVEVESRDWLGGAPPVTPPTPPPVTPPAAKPFPSFRVPEDIFLHAYTAYIGGLYARDQIDEPGGWKVASRGATMWFVPIFYEKIIALISSKGNQLPTPAEWWHLAEQGAAAAIDFYRRTAPPE